MREVEERNGGAGRGEAEEEGENDTIYSGASLNGPSQKRTTSLERTHTKAPIDFSMLLM